MGVELNSVVFNPGASAFSITPGSDSGSIALIISGAGIINNSGVTQNFAASSSPRATQSFTGSATAGDSVQYTVSGGDPSYGFGFDFYDNTMAATATFVINGGTDAAHRQAGHVSFWGDSTAEKATITLNGGHKGAYGGNADFYENSTASRARFSVNGATEKSASGGLLRFQGTTTADRAVITCLGSDISGPGDLYFQDSATAANATLIAKGGKALGGRIIFDAIGTPTGGTARVKLFGNGQLINLHSAGSPLEIGSLEGDGIVSLGEGILEVGNNGRDTTFSGVIQERVAIGLPASAGAGNDFAKDGVADSFVKIGVGTLTLTGASTYAGGTTIEAGTLLVKNTAGSATGSGAVQVGGGTLGGGGIIAGQTTIGTGSGAGGSLQPGKGASNAATITLRNTLIFKSDGRYVWKLNTKKAAGDQVVASGVTIETGAQFCLNTVANKKLTAGNAFTAISNPSASPIDGTFANLADGSTVAVGVNKLQVSYSGGDGNDLTLTVVP